MQFCENIVFSMVFYGFLIPKTFILQWFFKFLIIRFPRFCTYGGGLWTTGWGTGLAILIKKLDMSACHDYKNLRFSNGFLMVFGHTFSTFLHLWGGGAVDNWMGIWLSYLLIVSMPSRLRRPNVFTLGAHPIIRSPSLSARFEGLHTRSG